MDAERVIFNRLGWMRYYGAHPENGEPVGKESRKDEHAIDTGEKGNFKAGSDGRCRGLIHKERINIGRLGALPGESGRLGSLVVSIAPDAEGRGQFVVGWQARANVLRDRHKKGSRSYNYEAPIAEAVLLPIELRTIEIPRGPGGMGQTMFAFGKSTDGTVRGWVRDALAFIEGYDGPNLVTDPDAA